MRIGRIVAAAAVALFMLTMPGARAEELKRSQKGWPKSLPQAGNVASKSMSEFVDVGFVPFPAGTHSNEFFSAVAAGKDGRIYFGTCNSTGHPNGPWDESGAHLCVYDPETKEAKSLGDMQDVTGERGKFFYPQSKIHTQLCVADDGVIWFGTHSASWNTLEQLTEEKGKYPGGHVVSYDPRTGKFADYGIPVPGESLISMAIVPDRQLLFAVTHPSAHVVKFDIKSGKSEDLGKFNDKPTRTIIATKSGKVITFNSMGAVWRYDTAKGAEARPETLPVFIPNDTGKPMDGNLPAALCLGPSGERIYGGGKTGGHLFEYDAEEGSLGTMRSLGRSFGDEKGSWRLMAITRGPDDRIYWTRRYCEKDGVGEIWCYSIWTGEIYMVGKVRFDGKPQILSAAGAAAGADGTIYFGGGFITTCENDYKVEPWNHIGLVHFNPTVPKGFSAWRLAYRSPVSGNLAHLDFYSLVTGKDGRIYMSATAGYGEPYFMVYDPAKPWKSGMGNDANPRVLGDPVLDDRDIHKSLGVDGNGRVWGATSYNRCHLFRYDPDREWNVVRDKMSPINKSRKTDEPPNPIDYGPYVAGAGDWHMCQSLIIDRNDRIYGWAFPQADFFMFDPKTERFYTLFRLTIDGKGMTCHEMTLGKDGRIYTGAAGYFFVFDPDTRRLTATPIAGGSVDKQDKRIKPLVRTFELKDNYYANVELPKLDGETPMLDAVCTAPDGTIYFGAGGASTVWSYSPADGEFKSFGKWSSEGETGLAGITAGHNGMIYGGGSNNAFELDPKTGKFRIIGTVWQPFDDRFHAATTGADGTIYLGQRGGAMFYLFIYKP